MNDRPLRRAIVAVGPCDWEPKLVSAVAHPAAGIQVIRRCVYLVDAISALDACAADLMVISPHLVDLDETSSLLLQDHLCLKADQTTKVDLVGVAVSPAERHQLQEFGCALVVDFDPTDLQDFLTKLSCLKSDPEPSTKPLITRPGAAKAVRKLPAKPIGTLGPGGLVAILGTSGAPGRSSIAIALASELAGLGQETLLIDADVASPSLAILLGADNETSGLSAACRLAERDSLNGQTLQQVSHQVGPSFWLLAGAGITAQISTPRDAAIAKVFEVARRNYACVVVDVAGSELAEDTLSAASGPQHPGHHHAGPHAGGVSVSLAQAADSIVICAVPTPLGLSRLVAALSLLSDEKTLGSITVALNKCPRRKLKPLVDEVAQLLKTHAAAQPVVGIALDRRGFTKAELEAKPLTAVCPRSPTRKGVRRLRDSLKTIASD